MNFDRYSIHIVTTLYHKFKLITNKIKDEYPKNLMGESKVMLVKGVVALTCTI
jgi:hypothetical protein